MIATEKQVKMASKMYECRDTARRVLGAKYKERMHTYGLGIKAVMAGESMDSVLSAAIELVKKCDAPMEGIFVLAAAVEIIEPS